MSTVKSILRYIAIFIVTAGMLRALFLLVTLIPREKIQANMETSAEYLQQKGAAFPFTVLGLNCSKADYYADAVLLNIAYYLDPGHPAESIAWAHYYSEDNENWNAMVTDYLPTAVAKQPEPNQQYLRYWHGSLTIVRPLLMWLSISGIYKLLGAILWILLGSIVILLVRKGFKKEAVAFGLALIGVSIWYVPVCLEYIWMFLLMAITSLVAINLALKQQYQRMTTVFLCAGIIAAFLDFFTTETITLLIPLLFMYMIWHRQKDGAPDWIPAVKCAALWGTGYVAMWVMKWAFAAVILKRDVMPYVKSSIALHLGLSDQLSLPQLWMKSIRMNVRNLFFFNYGLIGAVLTLFLFFCLVFLPILSGRISLKKQIQKKWVVLYLIIGMIPYIRFLVLSSHSAVHGWFTYRAQAASIMAIIFVFFELVDLSSKQKYIGRK